MSEQRRELTEDQELLDSTIELLTRECLSSEDLRDHVMLSVYVERTSSPKPSTSEMPHKDGLGISEPDLSECGEEEAGLFQEENLTELLLEFTEVQLTRDSNTTVLSNPTTKREFSPSDHSNQALH